MASIVTSSSPKESARSAAATGGVAKRTRDGWLVTFADGRESVLFVRR